MGSRASGVGLAWALSVIFQFISPLLGLGNANCPASITPQFPTPYTSGGEGLMTGGGRRRLPSPASPLENDDLLSDILLRLPPAPSSLPRASLVCKRWRSLISDPAFLRRFRDRHRRNAPLLGFFTSVPRCLSFTPIQDPPDRLPPVRFSLNLDDGCRILGCRHGLVLLFDPTPRELVVWEPVTGYLNRLAVPPGFGHGGSAVVQNGAVVRAAGDTDGGDGHSIPFLVAVVGCDGALGFACVYSSETGEWGNLISTACPSMYVLRISPSTMIGGSLYWLLGGSTVGILEFDLDRHCLSLIHMPLNTIRDTFLRLWVMPGEGGRLGFLQLSGNTAHLWTRKTDCDGAAQWEQRTIDLGTLLPSAEVGFPALILGYAEEDKVSLLANSTDICMVQLESMQFKKSFEMSKFDLHHPFASVYTEGLDTGGGQDGHERWHNNIR
ncbi:hypothetical protein ACP70R_029362 [Stipagrostis hirtigluma subsp. patula]